MAHPPVFPFSAKQAPIYFPTPTSPSPVSWQLRCFPMPAQLTATPLLLQKTSSLPTGPLGSTESAVCNHTSSRSCLDQEGMLDPSQSR